MNDKIGIFYIATGVYKKYFNDFLQTVNYLFPNKQKSLVVISDGLKEHHYTRVGLTDVYVEDFIDYPYPFININKFQIINHYAEKYNIDIIVYFDSETYFIERDEAFFDDLINKAKNKLISLSSAYFSKFNFRDFIYSMEAYTLWGAFNRFDDYSFFYTDNYDTIDTSYQWVQTSFFMCSKKILDDINIILKDLIAYNMRVMGCKLNYSDEFFVNYIKYYYPEKFYSDFYAGSSKNDMFDSLFMYQKISIVDGKMKIKFGNTNFNFRMFMFNINSDEEINKFFIKNRNNFLLCSCNSHTNNDKIFFDKINLDDFWFNSDNNIILERGFYNDDFIQLYNSKIDTYSDLYIGFLNNINDYSTNFDYNKFYFEDYDYIEGYSFDDIKNIKFNDIGMCCFSKRYIEAYFNNDKEFKPKIYKL